MDDQTRTSLFGEFAKHVIFLIEAEFEDEAVLSTSQRHDALVFAASIVRMIKGQAVAVDGVRMQVPVPINKRNKILYVLNIVRYSVRTHSSLEQSSPR